MNEIVMMQAALFQIRAVIDSVEDTFMQSQLRLAANVLGGAIDAGAAGVNAAQIGDIEFALNDLFAVAGEVSADEAARIMPPLEMLRVDLATMKSSGALPAQLVNAVRTLQQKLKTRRAAIERQTYVENPNEPLPHPPEDLCGEAIVIRDRLAEAGFTTPALDQLIDDPANLRFHGINDVINELDVVTAGAQ
jgi:hypothetical protein